MLIFNRRLKPTGVAQPLRGVAGHIKVVVAVGDGVIVFVGVTVGVWVCVDVAVLVAVAVFTAVSVAVAVCVAVAVLVAVAVAVSVAVAVAVGVAVGVSVGVAVGAGMSMLAELLPPDNSTGDVSQTASLVEVCQPATTSVWSGVPSVSLPGLSSITSNDTLQPALLVGIWSAGEGVSTTWFGELPPPGMFELHDIPPPQVLVMVPSPT
jgi:hypothetical protein